MTHHCTVVIGDECVVTTFPPFLSTWHALSSHGTPVKPARGIDDTSTGTCQSISATVPKQVLQEIY